MMTKQVAFLLLALLLLASVARAQKKMTPEARHAFRDAQLLMDDKKYKEAAASLTQFFKTTTEPIPAQGYLMLGGALHQSGQTAKAAEVFRKGQAAYPKNEPLALNTAIAYYEAGSYKDAGRFFEKVYSIQKTPKPIHLFQAGSAYYSGEEYKDSARVMLTLLNRHKKHQKEWVKLALHALIGAKQFTKAEGILLKYLDLNPGEAPYWELLAKLYLDRNQYRQAASALEITYRLKKPSRQELERLASIYTYVEAPLMAAATLKRAYSNPDVKQATKIAMLAASAGRTDDAIKQLSSGNSQLTETKGVILYNARRFDEAADAFRQVLKKNSRAGESRYHLALCAWEKRDWDEARKEFKRLAGTRKFSNRIAVPLAVLEDLELARKEAAQIDSN